MKWIAISGSWEKINEKVEKDVRSNVNAIISQGDGIIAGGAINVDFIAVDEALKLDPSCKTIKIFIPVTLEKFSSYYFKKNKELTITEGQVENLIFQLTKVKKTNSQSLIENSKNKVINKKNYYKRNSDIIKAADELVAFHVNNSPGTKDTINKAYEKGIPVKLFQYFIE
jgi:hypothetical protein